AALRVVGITGDKNTFGEAVSREDDAHRVALAFGPAGKSDGNAAGERLDQPGGIVVTRHVLELDPGAAELEPVRDLLLVAGDRERAELRREDEADRMCDPVLGHLADDLLGPRRPVAHAEVAAVCGAELRSQRRQLVA